ncbi:MAG: gph [Rhizobium sp.]|nr:gph [Rhizobium sp.]
MTKITGILFDKDGTLLDFDKSWEPVNRRASLFAAAGDEVLADRLMVICGMDPLTGKVSSGSLFAAAAPSEIAAAMSNAGAPFEPEELTAHLDRFFIEGAENAVAVTDLPALFKRLKARGLHLGIASSDNEASIRAIAERMQFMPYVDYIAGYDSGHGVKPNPGMVEAFARRQNIDLSEIAVVGDNTHDLHMARNARAGLAIGVLTGTSGIEALEPHADYVLASIEELEGLLDRLPDPAVS